MVTAERIKRNKNMLRLFLFELRRVPCYADLRPTPSHGVGNS